MRAWNLISGKKKKNTDSWNIRTDFGPNLSFAVTEAYKLMRTNIMFSFPDEGVGHVIGITSSVQNEGKSSTACNTAYALSEAGRRVLLIEGDLRKPTLGSKLGLARSPGLTNLLVSRSDYRDVVQQVSAAPNLSVITSGDIPPNPSELLSSGRMEQLLQQLKQDYDYIVIDLPPVTPVSDAVAISKFIDGMAIVIRAHHSDQLMLAETLRQLEMVNVRVLGFVYRDSDEVNNKYGKTYGRKYYKYYKYYNAYAKK